MNASTLYKNYMSNNAQPATFGDMYAAIRHTNNVCLVYYGYISLMIASFFTFALYLMHLPLWSLPIPALIAVGFLLLIRWVLLPMPGSADNPDIMPSSDYDDLLKQLLEKERFNRILLFVSITLTLAFAVKFSELFF